MEIVQQFIGKRSIEIDLRNKLHAIWYILIGSIYDWCFKIIF